VRRVALDAVVEEARLRQGTSAVVRTITWRQQRLLRRQLALLDGVERRVTDPEDLADLLRLDHLATRIRRHAEDLAVLIGAIPGRGWTRPVPLVDVVRGAVSEIEDYARVDVGAVADVALVGRAVGDTIHLLAELIENACTFSPAESRVRVTADLVPNGLAIEVEDRGEGMSQAATAEANARLAAPGDRSSDRLGLYVVGQLAVRHAIQVHLRPSAYGGITAVVLVPPELVAVGAEEPSADDVTPADLADEIEVLFDADPVRRHLPAPAAPEPAAAGSASPAVAGLPKRVRQASLAPQLREPAAEESPATPAPARSPETLRSMLSAFQDGTARGRRETDP
jgi:hypothetical protein